MLKDVYVHAGAHRTGTSSFQLFLAQNRARLEAEGFDLAYPKRDGVAGGKLHLRLPGPKQGPARLPDFAAKVSKNLRRQVTEERGRLILSDENLPGLIAHFFSGRLYPNRRRRFQAFRQGLEAVGGRLRAVLLVVRPYDELFVSGYRKHAEDNAVPDFEEIAARMTAFRGGWPETVQALQNVLEPERLVVVPYAARGRNAALLEQLIGEKLEGLVEPEQALNVSATDAALEALQLRYRAGEALERGAWQAVIAECARDREARGFAAFSSAQRSALRARYEADLARLGEIEGATLLT